MKEEWIHTPGNCETCSLGKKLRSMGDKNYFGCSFKAMSEDGTLFCAMCSRLLSGYMYILNAPVFPSSYRADNWLE